eukprot:gnl/Hemi2/28201_TR9309_c0_g2_i1.p2 gnl/Hemi2/28201_TR9309_c0_g2~~gnl/Hemi2/28201_TR9309_c0_g2_i1.p2  ORF type:complete len:191 (+),score=43.45 gnl/Hemi2/28201_TR9309_c0_g2_i1:169-741(+)
MNGPPPPHKPEEPKPSSSTNPAPAQHQTDQQHPTSPHAAAASAPQQQQSQLTTTPTDLASLPEGLPEALNVAAAAVIDGCLVLVACLKAKCYDPATKAWRDLPDPSVDFPRGCASCALGGSLYLAAGAEDERAAQAFSLAANRWAALPSACHARHWRCGCFGWPPVSLWGLPCLHRCVLLRSRNEGLDSC